MKKFTQILLFVTALFVVSNANSQNVAPNGPWDEYSTGGSTNGVDAKTSWAVVSANSKFGGTPTVDFVSWSSDLASSQLTTYFTTNYTSVNNTNLSTLTIIPVATTNGFSQGTDVVVIRHMANDTYERRNTSNSTIGATNISITIALSTPVVQGDLVYKMVSTGAENIPLGVGTNTITATAGFCSGQPGLPYLIELTGTAAGAAKLNAVHAHYTKAP